MATPMLGQFLTALNGFIRVRNASELASYLVLEPPFSTAYSQIIAEVRQTYPPGREDALEQKCAHSLPEAERGDQGSTWTAFVRFMVQYLKYLRDVSADQTRYRETYDLLSELQAKSNSALGHSTLGVLMLETAIANARLVCRLAIGLDRRPELLGPLVGGAQAGEDSGPRETLPEKAANTIRVAFTTALNERSGTTKDGLDSDGRPEGRRKGVYALANLCLKILFQCRKTRNASQIFQNITSNAPPLSAYPKAQRVTYLYYLGRFLFQNNHFHASQTALQAAYDESPASEQCTKQRRLILIHLITSNIILGRFPSQALLSRPEARGLSERFMPLCLAIRAGNLPALERHLSLDGEHAPWFLHFRILLQLRNRCEVLAWRSLLRKIFVLHGIYPEPGSNKAALLSLPDVLAIFRLLSQPSPSHSSSLGGEDGPDPDLEGADIDPESDSYALAPDDFSIVSILSSLIDQGLLRGFVAHRQKKLAILGAKNFGGNAVIAGFPPIWGVLGKKGVSGVPGWK